MALQCHAVWFDWWGTWGLHIYSKGVVIASDSGGSEYDCFDESLIEQNLQDEEIPETQSPTKIEDVPEIVATSRFFDIPLKNYFCIVLDEDDVAEIDRLPYDVLSGFFNDIGIPGELYRFCGKILLSNIRSVPRQNPFSSFRFYICGLDSKTPHQPQHPKSATNDQQD